MSADDRIDRPPAYVSRKTLARELDCAESTVDEMVRRGVLPKGTHWSNGCVRWRWADVEAALNSLSPGTIKKSDSDNDPFLRGVRDVATTE